MTDKRTYDLTTQATLDTDAFFVIDKSGWATARRIQGSVLDAYFVEVTGDTMTGDLTFSGAFHPVIAPGSDTDADLLTVTVTDTPTFSWDESEDGFLFSKPIYSDGFRAEAATGSVLVRFDPIVTDGSSDAYVAAFRNTSTSGAKYFFVYKGDGSNTVYHALANTYVTFNEQGVDIDFNIEGANDVNAFYVDAGNDRVGVGLAAPSAKLHVDQSSDTGAQPVLLLDQADIDLEFIKFVGSSEDSQADRSLVDAADMTTPGALTGWIQVYVEDVQSTNPITDGVYYIPFYAAPSA